MGRIIGGLPDYSKSYIEAFGGEDNWEKWLESSPVPEDMREVARRGALLGYRKDWEKFQAWNKQYIWENREQFSEDRWNTIAANYDLPVNRSLKLAEPEPEKGSNPVQWIADDIASVAEVAGTAWVNKDLLFQMAKTWVKDKGPEFARGVHNLITQEPDALGLMFFNEARRDLASTADMLIPDAVENFFNNEFTIHVPYTSEEDRKVREQWGYTEDIPIMPTAHAGKVLDKLGKWFDDYELARVTALRAQGYPEASIKAVHEGLKFTEIGLAFYYAPEVRALQAGRAVKHINRLKSVMGAAPSPAQLERMATLVKREERALRAAGGVTDEVVKGLFVGTVTGDGSPHEKMHEATLWGALGVPFGYLNRFMRFLFSKNAGPTFQKLLEQHLSPQDARAVLTQAASGDKDSMSVVMQEAADALTSSKLLELTVKVPREEDIPILEQHRALTRAIEELDDPKEIRINRIRMEEDRVRSSMNVPGEEPPPPKTPEQIDLELSQQDAEYTNLVSAIRELEQANPEVFQEGTITYRKRITGEIPDKTGQIREIDDLANVYVRSKKAGEIPPGAVVKHTRHGQGVVVEKVPDGRYVIQFAKTKTTLKPHAEWQVLTGRRSEHLSQFDLLKIAVEDKDLEPRQALIELIAQRFNDGDPAAQYEALKSITADMLGNEPKNLEQWPDELLEFWARYLEAPRGQHIGWQYGDPQVIVDHIEANGWAPIFKLPYNAPGPMGGEIISGGPLAKGYKGLREDIKNIFTRHQRAHSNFGALKNKTAPTSEIEQLMRDRGYQISVGPPTGEKLPNQDAVRIIYRTVPGTGKPVYKGAEWRVASEVPFTPEQQLKHWQDMTALISKPDTWQLILPKTPPTIYADESANALSKYLKSTPIWEDMPEFNPNVHTKAIVNPSTGDRFGVESMADAQDVIVDAATLLKKDPMHLTYAEKIRGKWEVVLGVGEKDTQDALKQVFEEEFEGVAENSIMAQALKDEMKLGERAQEFVSKLETEPDPEASTAALKELVAEASKGESPTDHYVKNAHPSWLEPGFELYNQGRTRGAAQFANARAMERGENFGLVSIDLTNAGLINNVASHDTGTKMFQSAARVLKKVADKHGLALGRDGGDEFLMWGNIKNPQQVRQDVQYAFKDFLDEAPEVARLLFTPDGPVMVQPAVGVKTGRGVSFKALIDEAEADMKSVKLLMKAKQYVDGFFVQKGFSQARPPKLLPDGSYEFVSDSTGEVVKVRPGTTDLWEEMAYAKLYAEGAKIRWRKGRIEIVRNGQVQYTAPDFKSVALIEAQVPIHYEGDLTRQLTEAGVKGIPGGAGGKFFLPDEGEYAPGTLPPKESEGELIKWLYKTTRSTVLDMDRTYNFPFRKYYDDLEAAHWKIHAGMTDLDKELLKITTQFPSQKVQGIVGSILTLPSTEQAAALKGFGDLETGLFGEMKEMFHRLWKKLDIPEKYWDDVFDLIDKKKSGLMRKEIAREPWVDILDNLFTEYELRQTRLNVISIHHKIARNLFKREYMLPIVQDLRKASAAAPLSKLPEEIKFEVVPRIIDAFMSTADGDYLSLGRAFKRLFRGAEWAEKLGKQIPAILLSLQYGATMAWRVGLPLRNFFQPVVVGGPLIGTKWVRRGYAAMRDVVRMDNPVFEGALTGKLTLQDFKHQGLWQEYLPIPALQAIQDPMGALGWTGRIHGFTRKGLAWQHMTDRWNRLTMMLGAVQKQEFYLEQALRTDKDFKWFARKTDMNMFHEVDRARWNDLWDAAKAGDPAKWREMIVDFGKRVADETNWVYAGFANPRAFHSVLSKMLVQYGVWPANYFNYLTQRGFLNSAAKTKFWLRWAGIHGTIASVGIATGLPLTNWVFFSPLNYTGGPFLQYTIDMLHAMNSRPEGRVERMWEVNKRFAGQMVPIYGGLWKTDARKAIANWNAGNYVGALLAPFRLATWPEEQKKKEKERQRRSRKSRSTR